jgi:cytochrome c
VSRVMWRWAQGGGRPGDGTRRLVFLAAAGTVLLTTCGPGALAPPVKAVPGGDPERGRAAISRYGCGACHAIPGVVAAHGQVGPALGGVAGRAVIAGRLANTPDNLVRWIQHPQAVAPGTVMPEMGVTEADARDIAAYLYTLR